MMSKLQKLRMELRAELELMEVRSGEFAKSTAKIGKNVDRCSREIDRLSKEVVAISHRVGSISQEVTVLSQEVGENARWMKGRYRSLGDRFDKILEAVAHDQQTDHELLHNLAERVARLEEAS